MLSSLPFNILDDLKGNKNFESLLLNQYFSKIEQRHQTFCNKSLNSLFNFCHLMVILVFNVWSITRYIRERLDTLPYNRAPFSRVSQSFCYHSGLLSIMETDFTKSWTFLDGKIFSVSQKIIRESEVHWIVKRLI